MIERKYCKCCGQLISDINIEGTDFYRHIRIKYCPECRDMMQHYQSALRQHNYRQRNKQAQKLRDERISLLAAVFLRSSAALTSLLSITS